MLVFVDESGDAGFKFAQNSSQYFVVAMVVFAGDEDAENANLVMVRLHQLLQHPSEFKFSKLSSARRLEIAQAVGGLSFQGFAMVFDKAKFSDEQVKNLGADGYQWFIATALGAFVSEIT